MTLADVLFVTALEDERSSVARLLPGSTFDGRDVLATLPRASGRPISVALVCLNGMGQLSAYEGTRDAIQRRRPRLVVLVGIAAGFSSPGREIAAGDVLVPRGIIGYALAKEYEEPRGWVGRLLGRRRLVVQPRGLTLDVDQASWTAAAAWAPHAARDGVWAAVGAPRPDGTDAAPRVHAHEKVLLGSGDRIVATALSAIHGAVRSRGGVGVEMESYGAIEATRAEDTRLLVVKAVSDDGVEKGDDWRAYACATSAAFGVALVQRIEIPPSRQEIARLRELADDFRAHAPNPEYDFVLSVADSYAAMKRGLVGSVWSRGQLFPGVSHPAIVLHGGAGAGKSTVMRQLLVESVDSGLDVSYLDLKVTGPRDAESWELPDGQIVEQLVSLVIPAATPEELKERVQGGSKILVDGLNEVPQKVRSVLVRWLDEMGRSGPCFRLLADRLGPESTPEGYTHVRLEAIAEPQRQQAVDTAFGVGTYLSLSETAREVLGRPFFLSRSLRLRREELARSGPPSDLIENFFRSAGLADAEVDELARLLISSADPAAWRLEARLRERLEGADILSPDGRFVHQLWADYLYARGISAGPGAWSPSLFDRATVSAGSPEVLRLGLELMSEPDVRDAFIKAVYDWNWRAALDSLSGADAIRDHASPSVRLAIVASVAEKRFDHVPATRRRGERALSALVPDPQLRLVLDAPSDPALRDVVQAATSQENWFISWKTLFVGGAPAVERDEQAIASSDPLVGWAAANASRRGTLSAQAQERLRALYRANQGLAGVSVRWRVIHALSVHPNADNAELVTEALAQDTYPWIRFYGAPRAAMEMSAADASLRTELIGLLRDRVRAVSEIPVEFQGLFLGEIADVSQLEDGVDNWERDVIPLVAALTAPGESQLSDARASIVVRLASRAAERG